MNKTGLKTFVCSFGITLFAILGADRAFFYTPKPAEDYVQIPRKNITLFFSSQHPRTFSSQIEPVHSENLQVLEKVEIVQNNIITSADSKAQEIPLFLEDENIPIQREVTEVAEVSDNIIQKEELKTVLSSKGEDLLEPPSSAEKVSIIAQNDSVITPQIKLSDLPTETIKEDEKTKYAADDIIPLETDLMNKPIVLQAKRKIIKIDNVQRHKQKLASLLNAGKQDSKPEEIKNIDSSNDKESDFIPLVSGAKPVNSFETIEIADKPEANQIASLDVKLPSVQTDSDKKEEDTKVSPKWQTMAEKHKNDNPWVVARGSKFVKNRQLLKENYSSDIALKRANEILPAKGLDKTKSAKVAVQDNILIPIPQDLLEEDNLVPDLGGANIKKNVEVKKEEKKESTFLDNITSVFSKENREKAVDAIKQKASKVLATSPAPKKETPHKQILPTEIRLSFQPNRAEISGPTLRWVQAFAKKSVDEGDVGLEIRIDGSNSFALQQKRLNLLYNILTAHGVDYQKINTVFVDREPNSFVMRAVKITRGVQQTKEDDSWKKYYQQW